MVVQVDLQDAPHPGAFRQDMSSEVRPHVRANLLFKDELWYATRCLQTLLPGASHSLLSSNRSCDRIGQCSGLAYQSPDYGPVVLEEIRGCRRAFYAYKLAHLEGEYATF
jgi:hypothetical protein